jgi:alkanesulfonate monooxygenase SsuD/methylene tetrahydromethanopterin reductase-like flavin-dependent oxidoreductase (luciferase family)
MSGLQASAIAVSFSGDYVRFKGARQSLTPVQKPHPPILVGGTSAKAIEAATEYGDGWFPIHEPGLEERIGGLRATVAFAAFGAPPADETIEAYATVGVERLVFDVGAGDATTLSRLATLARRHPDT